MNKASALPRETMKLRKHYIRERLTELKAERERLIEERTILDETLAMRRSQSVGSKGLAVTA